MAKPTKFTPKQTLQGWRINIPGKFTESGKRERHFYQNREAANDAAKKLRLMRDENGTRAKNIAPSLAEQATAAAAILAPFGLSLMDAARVVADIELAKQRSSTVEAALTAYLEVKAGRSEVYKRKLGYMATALCEDFPSRLLSTITGSELEQHAERHSGGATAFNLRCTLLSGFWRWCANPKRGWCKTHAVQHFEKKDCVSQEIGTLSPMQAKALLQAAEQHYPDCVPGFAIALFTGMRQAELERLEPSDITVDGITVPAKSSKTMKRRFIDMPPALAPWLEVYPVKDSVLPANWERKDRAVRRLAGFRVWCDLIDPNEPPDDLPAWPSNALRHTAATVALATGKPIATLIFEHGHSGGEITLKNHYIGRMTKRHAEEILALRPERGTCK